MRRLPSLMYLAVGLCLALVVPHPVGADELVASRKTKKTSFDRYLEKMKASPGNILELSDQTFRSLVVDKDSSRAFHVVVLFTTSNPKYQCRVCGNAEEDLSQISTSYLMQRGLDVQQIPIIFAKLEVDRGQNTFQAFQLQTVPHTYIFKAKTAVPRPPMGDIEIPWQKGPESITGYLKERLQVDIQLIQDPLFTIQAAVTAAALLGILTCLVISEWKFFQRLPWHPTLWLCVSLSVYGLGIGGMIFCIIRSSPFVINQGGNLMPFLMHSSQDQLVFEGLYVSSLNIMTAFSFLSMYTLASPRRWKLVQIIGPTIALAFGIFFLQRLFEMYQNKVRWYRITETWHQPVREFVSSSVKGSSGLIKRLLRASDVWLYEFKSWPLFQKKMYELLVKYANRRIKFYKKRYLQQ